MRNQNIQDKKVCCKMSTVKPIKTRLAWMSMTKIALFVGLSSKYWENRNFLNDGEAFHILLSLSLWPP